MQGDFDGLNTGEGQAAGGDSLRESLDEVDGFACQLGVDGLSHLGVVDSVGEIVAREIHDFFRLAHNTKLVEVLRKRGLNFGERDERTAPASQELAGETWVITGTLSRPRDEIAELIRRHGGSVSGSVSKKTSYVLAGEEAGSKLDKAKSLGVTVVDETMFRTRIV